MSNRRKTRRRKSLIGLCAPFVFDNLHVTRVEGSLEWIQSCKLISWMTDERRYGGQMTDWTGLPELSLCRLISVTQIDREWSFNCKQPPITKRIIKRRRLELSEFQFRTGQSDYRLNALPRAIELDALTVFTIHGWPSYGFIGWGVVGGGRHGKGSCRKCRVRTAVGFLKSTQRVTMIEMRSSLCGLCLWAVGDRNLLHQPVGYVSHNNNRPSAFSM